MCRFSSVKLLGVLLLAGVGFCASASTGRRERPIIRQADHLLIRTADPKHLFDFFDVTLQMPVAWPFVDNGTYASGGVGTGNFMIQIFNSGDPAPSSGRQARYAGLAFEPYSLAASLSELELRGISHGEPQPYTSALPDKSRGVLWTTVGLTALAVPGMDVFLYEYSPAFLNVYVRRNQLAGQLALRRGGPLGLDSVGEVVLSSGNLKRDTSLWQKLFDPVEPASPGVWKVGDGPVIRLVPGSPTRIERLTLIVKSLDQARTFLRNQKMLGAVAPDYVAINPAAVQGLGIRLRQVHKP